MKVPTFHPLILKEKEDGHMNGKALNILRAKAEIWEPNPASCSLHKNATIITPTEEIHISKMVCNFHHHVRHLSVRGFIWVLTFTSLSYRTGEVNKATLNLVLRFKPSVTPSSTILFK